MILDIENAKKEFLKYVKQYNNENPKISQKIGHSLRVMNEAEGVAKSLYLNEDEIEIAKLIGLLHDIGRFEQIKIYEIYEDYKSIDHGDLGAEILSKNNYIRKYIENNDYDDIILKAIKNHNKFTIEEGLTEKEMLYAKIIRDADKLDIFFEGAEFFWNSNEEIEAVEKAKITPQILKEYENKKLINRKEVKTSADEIISFIAFKHDINFEYSINRINEQKYIKKIINKFDFKDLETKKIMRQLV